MEDTIRKKSFSIVFMVIVFGLIAVSSGTAQTTHNVSTNPEDFATIAEAIDAASDGDTVRILSAEHTEEGIIVSKSLTIQGTGSGTTTVQAHADRGQATNRVFEILTNTVVTIEGMTIRHGNAPDGTDGVNAGDSGVTGGHGGGIYNAGTLTLTDCMIAENDAGNGGSGATGDSGTAGADGAKGDNGPAPEGAFCNPVWMTCCTEKAPPHGCNGKDGVVGEYGANGQAGGDGGDGGDGGGVYTTGILTLTDCTFSNNSAGNGGDSAPGGNGGNGGIGGYGGKGGDAEIYTQGYGGDGGNGANGGNGGLGGNGGDAGDAGDGGGVFKTVGATLNIGAGCAFSGNKYGVPGDHTNATAGTAGLGGTLGLGGEGGQDGSGWLLEDRGYGESGTDGSAGTNGTDGTAGQAGAEGSVTNYINIPTLTAIVVPFSENDDLATAESGGTVSSTGGPEIEERGVCWNTQGNPNVQFAASEGGGVTTDDTDNVGIGSFISTITGLTVDTTYYFRAYATNSEGTAYYPNTG
ncbi:MAG: hypothetical protein GY749_32370, partial [Desulfobacteraceae bacterium]|nr:hypothetical protein [Desulfobacteraceae bacterium]